MASAFVFLDTMEHAVNCQKLTIPVEILFVTIMVFVKVGFVSANLDIAEPNANMVSGLYQCMKGESQKPFVCAF